MRVCGVQLPLHHISTCVFSLPDLLGFLVYDISNPLLMQYFMVKYGILLSILQKKSDMETVFK